MIAILKDFCGIKIYHLWKKIKSGNADVPVIPLEAIEIRDRFMDEIKKNK